MLGSLRREAARLLASDSQNQYIAVIKRSVAWASLAGAAAGVVLAFAAAEPYEPDLPKPDGRARPGHLIGPNALAAHASAGPSRQPPRGELPAPSASPPPSEASVRPEAPALPIVDHQNPAARDLAMVEGQEAKLPSRSATIAATEPAPETAPATVTLPAAPAKRRRPQGPASPARTAAAAPVNESRGEHIADADELIWLAERAFQAGHSAEAVRLGRKALSAGGGVRARLAMAAGYFDMRDFDHARSAYEAVLAEDPGNQAARAGLEVSRSALASSVARAP